MPILVALCELLCVRASESTLHRSDKWKNWFHLVLFGSRMKAMSAAAEQLQQAGFRVDASTGSYRLIRSDGSQGRTTI